MGIYGSFVCGEYGRIYSGLLIYIPMGYGRIYSGLFVFKSTW